MLFLIRFCPTAGDLINALISLAEEENPNMLFILQTGKCTVKSLYLKSSMEKMINLKINETISYLNFLERFQQRKKIKRRLERKVFHVCSGLNVLQYSSYKRREKGERKFTKKNLPASYSPLRCQMYKNKAKFNTCELKQSYK